MCITVAHYILQMYSQKTQMYFIRRNVYYVTKKKQWAFVVIFFGGWGGGRGVIRKKKPVLYRKKDIIYYIHVHVYEYTNLTKIEIFVSQNKIYILGNCKQSTWCPVVHWSLFYYWSQANYTEVQLISFWFDSFWWRSSFCKTIHVPLFFSGSTVISCQ